MSNKKPKTIGDFFNFYYDDFKPLYNHLQSINEPPIELFFETNAALDHLSRHWKYNEDEEKVVGTACAHIKRGCFDAFKIITRDTIDHYKELLQINTSVVDNGQFDKNMRLLINKIKTESRAARQAEGDSRDEEAWHKAFELWEPVYVDCVRFDKEFYLNEKVEWARRKQGRQIWRSRLEGLAVSIAAGIVILAVSWLPWNCQNQTDQNTPGVQETQNKLTPTTQPAVGKPSTSDTSPLPPL